MTSIRQMEFREGHLAAPVAVAVAAPPLDDPSALLRSLASLDFSGSGGGGGTSSNGTHNGAP
jgi:hypothetical protein